MKSIIISAHNSCDLLDSEVPAGITVQHWQRFDQATAGLCAFYGTKRLQRSVLPIAIWQLQLLQRGWKASKGGFDYDSDMPAHTDTHESTQGSNYINRCTAKSHVEKQTPECFEMPNRWALARSKNIPSSAGVFCSSAKISNIVTSLFLLTCCL